MVLAILLQSAILNDQVRHELHHADAPVSGLAFLFSRTMLLFFGFYLLGSMAGAAVLSTGVSLAVAFAAIAMPTLFAAASLYALGRRRAGEGRALGVLRQPENYRTR